LRDHLETRELCRPERCRQGNIRRIAAGRHKDTPDARRVVASVRRMPVTAEIDLEPGAEVHRIGIDRHADISQIAGAISRRDVHATAQRNGKMRKIPADTSPVGKPAIRRSERIRLQVIETDVIVDEVADSPDALPSEWGRRKPSPGKIGEPVGIAVAAAEQEDQHLIRQVVNRMLKRAFRDNVRLPVVINLELRGNRRQPRRSDNATAGIAEDIGIVPSLDLPVESQYLIGQQIDTAGGMNVQHHEHRGRLPTLVAYMESSPYFHPTFPVGEVGHAQNAIGKRRRHRGVPASLLGTGHAVVTLTCTYMPSQSEGLPS